MALPLTTDDLDEKTALVDNDSVMVFDSEDVDLSTSLPFWKKVKVSNLSNYSSNISGRLYLHSHIF
jgi:hypothetical protein